MGPNAWYSGALDYVTTNPWAELQAETTQGRPGVKAWLLVTLKPGEPPQVALQPVPLARQVIELPAINATGLTAEQVNAQLAAHATGEMDGQIVRQRVHEIAREVSQGIDYRWVRRMKSAALQYQLTLSRAQETRALDNVVFDGGRRRTLAEIVADKLMTMPLPPDIDRERLVALGAHYLHEAERADATPAEGVAA